MTQYSKQSGSTLAGVVIGMTAGLLIAVGVALILTNSSIPFAGTADPGADGKNGKVKVLADPNEPMYPKRDLMESVAREITKKMENSGKTAADALQAVTPLLGQRDTAQPPAATAAVPPQQVAMQAQRDKPQPVEGLIYYLQAGAFLNRNEAEGVKGRLALLGLSAHLSQHPSDRGTLYRVRVGPFSQIEEMREARTILANNGVQSVIVRP